MLFSIRFYIEILVSVNRLYLAYIMYLVIIRMQMYRPMVFKYYLKKFQKQAQVHIVNVLL